MVGKWANVWDEEMAAVWVCKRGASWAVGLVVEMVDSSEGDWAYQ